MKSKAKQNTEDKSINARPLPVEEFARLVECLDEADIEAACAGDGAPPGGLPSAWSRDIVATLRLDSAIEPQKALATARQEWRASTTESSSPSFELTRGVVIACGNELAAVGVENGATLDIRSDIVAREGDLVIIELKGFGRLLRRLRFVGGAALLCSGNRERPAIPLEDTELKALKVVVPRR